MFSFLCQIELTQGMLTKSRDAPNADFSGCPVTLKSEPDIQCISLTKETVVYPMKGSGTEGGGHGRQYFLLHFLPEGGGEGVGVS